MKTDHKSKIISVKREKAGEESQREVTIVLNVYNAGKTIDSFLDSLEVQTFKDFLLLVIDDGSTDQTVEKIKRYKDKFDMVVCLCPHQGLRRARKFGISKAKGNIILILDADLILDKNAVKEIVEPLKDKDVGGVGGFLKSKGDGSIAAAYGALREVFCSLRSRGKETDWIAGGFSGVKKEIITLIGGYSSDDISEDLDISWRIKNEGYKLILNEKAIAYHRDPKSIKEVWKRERAVGVREYKLTTVHPKESLKIRRLLRFYPISIPFLVPFIAIIYWPLLIFLFLIPYIGILVVVKGSFKCKNASWLVFHVMNFAYCTGFFSALVKSITHR